MTILRFRLTLLECLLIAFATTFSMSMKAMAQAVSIPSAAAAQADAQTLSHGQTALQSLRDGDVALALTKLGEASDMTSPGGEHIRAAMAAAGGLHRALTQMATDEQYDLLHQWSMPTKDRSDIRILTSLVSEVAPPQEFARALGERPKKESFAVAAVGDVSGLFCTAWAMVLAADDAGHLRQLMTELEGLAAAKAKNAEFVLTLAKLRDSRSSQDELLKLLTARVAPDVDVRPASDLSDAVLVAAAMQHPALGSVCEQIVERLNQFDFAQGSSLRVPFLRRLRATVILKNRAPETDPAVVLYTPPRLWISANDQNHSGHFAGTNRAIWLTHEDHVKRLAGPGDDLLLFRYPLTGAFELKGEVTALDHGGAGLSYGGLTFDANPEKFTVQEVQRAHFESRIWPFVAPKELRMFNRVNIRSDSEKVTFLSNLHPGWNGSVTSTSSCPWLGLRAFGDGRVYFRNLELIGEPQIPRAVRIADGSDLRGWTAIYGETLPHAIAPFQQPAAPTALSEPTDWYVADGIIHGRMATTPVENQVSQSLLTYMRPLLDGETLTYEFFHEDNKTSVHPALGRLGFLIETGGVRMHWLTDNASEWTGLASDSAVVEPLNRRGPRSLPIKPADWNIMTLNLADEKVQVSLNGEVICERPVDDITNRHIGFYHDRNTSAVQIRNVVLTGNWPEKLSAEDLQKLVAVDGP